MYTQKNSPLYGLIIINIYCFFKVAIRVLNTVMEKMLPTKLQNLDVDLNLEDIEAELDLKTEFENKMNAHKGLTNVTSYREKANQVFLVRQHVRGIQQSQVNLVSAKSVQSSNLIIFRGLNGRGHFRPY